MICGFAEHIPATYCKMAKLKGSTSGFGFVAGLSMSQTISPIKANHSPCTLTNFNQQAVLSHTAIT